VDWFVALVFDCEVYVCLVAWVGVCYVSVYLVSVAYFGVYVGYFFFDFVVGGCYFCKFDVAVVIAVYLYSAVPACVAVAYCAEDYHGEDE